MTEQIPFTQSYVLRATAKHIRKSIDISIRKTSERWADFKDNPEKTKEITVTLMLLHEMRRNLDQFQEDNAESFKENYHG